MHPGPSSWIESGSRPYTYMTGFQGFIGFLLCLFGCMKPSLVAFGRWHVEDKSRSYSMSMAMVLGFHV